MPLQWEPRRFSRGDANSRTSPGRSARPSMEPRAFQRGPLMELIRILEADILQWNPGGSAGETPPPGALRRAVRAGCFRAVPGNGPFPACRGAPQGRERGREAMRRNAFERSRGFWRRRTVRNGAAAPGAGGSTVTYSGRPRIGEPVPAKAGRAGGAAAVTIIRLAASVDDPGPGRYSAPSGRWQPPFERGP